jgi:hypothetical protein
MQKIGMKNFMGRDREIYAHKTLLKQISEKQGMNM